MMEPLRVTAHLVNGYAVSDPYSPALDGILAGELLRERLGPEEFALGQSGHRPLVIVDDLPLERVEDDGQWWWSCSSPIANADGRELRYYHRRFNEADAVQFLPAGTKKILTSAGPFKNYRHGQMRTWARSITWHCIGDAVEVSRLLTHVTHLGSRRAAGIGALDLAQPWAVTRDGDAGLAHFHRPLPHAYALAHGIDGPLDTWGIRPPGRLREHQTLCVMPR